ncbi:MAG: endolytic transglycosylase MltG [Candidatus Margulisiibacteriota bacterium]
MKIKIIIAAFIFLLFSCSYFVFFRSADLSNESLVKISIENGMSARKIQSCLVEKNVLPRHSAFFIIIKVFRLENRIKAGTYAISPSETVVGIINKITRGQTIPQEEIQVTFPEGTSIYKMGIILKKTGYKKWELFQGLADEGITADLRQRHWGIFKYIPSESLEGYLFPDTYRIYADASVEVLAEVMLGQFEKIVVPYWNSVKNKTKLSLHETLTLASIIEKEAKKPEERPIIASVFYNRLSIGMPLGADPTVKYALERPTKRVLYSQLNVNSLYNTYKRKGLPPGPICNPGIASIKEAVNPAKTGYFFFVANKDGSHMFSRNWEEHQRARLKATKK